MLQMQAQREACPITPTMLCGSWPFSILDPLRPGMVSCCVTVTSSPTSTAGGATPMVVCLCETKATGFSAKPASTQAALRSSPGEPWFLGSNFPQNHLSLLRKGFPRLR